MKQTVNKSPQQAKEATASCSVCNCFGSALTFKGKQICQDCISAVKAGELIEVHVSID